MGPLLAQLAGLDPQALIFFARQAQIHITEVVEANKRLEALVAVYQERIDKKLPLMTDEERQSLLEKIDADGARYEANDPDRTA